MATFLFGILGFYIGYYVGKYSKEKLMDGCDVDKMNNQIEIIKDLENQNFESFLKKLKELIEEYSFCNHEKFKILYVEGEFFLNFKERIEKYLDEIIKIEEKKQIDKLEKKQNCKLNS